MEAIGEPCAVRCHVVEDSICSLECVQGWIVIVSTLNSWRFIFRPQGYLSANGQEFKPAGNYYLIQGALGVGMVWT